MVVFMEKDICSILYGKSWKLVWSKLSIYLSLFTIEKSQDWIFLLIIISNFSDKMTYLLWQNDKYEFSLVKGTLFPSLFKVVVYKSILCSKAQKGLL